MADGVLHDVAVLEVRDALVGVILLAPARIRPRDERAVSLEREAGLKGERRVLQLFLPLDRLSGG